MPFKISEGMARILHYLFCLIKNFGDSLYFRRQRRSDATQENGSLSKQLPCFHRIKRRSMEFGATLIFHVISFLKDLIPVAQRPVVCVRFIRDAPGEFSSSIQNFSLRPISLVSPPPPTSFQKTLYI